MSDLTSCSSTLQKKQNKSAIVFGGAGFLGFHLCTRLALDGWSVVAIDSFKGGKNQLELEMQKRRAAVLHRDTNVQLVEADLLETDTMKQLFKEHDFQTVVHLVQREGPMNAELNTRLTQQTFDLCTEFNVEQLVWVSPYFGFETSQYSGETTVRSLFHSLSDDSQLHVSMLRLSIVYGDYSRKDMPFFYDMINIEKGQGVVIFCEMELRLEYVHVDDFVDFVVRVLSDRQEEKVRVIDVGVGHPVHNREQLAREMGSVMNKTVQFRLVPNLRRYRKDAFKPPVHLDVRFNKSVPLHQGLTDLYQRFQREF